MQRRSEIPWCSAIMLCKIVLVSVLLHQTLGFDIFDEEARDSLVPVGHGLGRPGYWTLFEEKKQGGGMVPYPRLGRKIFELPLPQTVIPYPRAGRTVVDPESFDYDIVMASDYAMPGFEDPWTDAFLESRPLFQKRGSIKLIPRIGRKKRSISEEHIGQDAENNNQHRPTAHKADMSSPIWEELEELDGDYYYRPGRQSARSRNAFVPRVGKKSIDEDIDELESKRAVAFTPRIGRASLIPRIGRNDPRFKVKSRGAFIPRIGRRAALTPRIGRSDSHMENDDTE